MRILPGVCLSVMLSVILVGCGEGDSTTGGGGDTSASATETPQSGTSAGSSQSSSAPQESTQGPSPTSNSAGSLAGTYTGNADVAVTIDTLNLTYDLEMEIVIRPDGEVLVDVEGKTDTTTLDGDAYAGDVEFEETRDGITCSGRIFYRGTVNGSTTSGTTSGDGVCNQNGNLADVTLNGSYVASRQQ